MADGSNSNSTITYNSTSVGYLKVFADISATLGLEQVANYLGKYDDPFVKLSDINPIFKFIGALYEISDKKIPLKEYATLITGTGEIINSTLNLAFDINEGKKTAFDISQDVGNIVSKFTKVTGAMSKLEIGSKPYFIGMLAAEMGLVADVIGSIDGLEVNIKELKEITKSSVDLLSEIIEAVVKDFVKDETKKDSLTSSLGPIALATSAITGLISGAFKLQETIQKYTDDGIPKEIATKDAIIDFVTTTIHDTASSFTKGVDDIAFKWVQGFASWVTGIEISDNDKNYVEWIGEIFKTLNVKNSGTTSDDMLIIDDNGSMIYGDAGNDYIRNFASNATIWAGHDNDTIFSHENTQNNSIFGGAGIDYIVGFDTNSTFYGGTENDKIAIYGNKNKIFGEEGNDAILLSGGSNNIVNGGFGNDIIILEGSKNSIIEYSEGDGNDIIYGYEENDRINIAGNYSTSTSGQNVLLLVGTETITLDSAKGLIINVNGKKIDTADTVSSGVPVRPVVSPLVTVPSLWYDNVKTIRGTSLADNIKNTLDSIMIDVLAGNDTIDNRGSQVTIDAGDGNNLIYIYDCSQVTVNTGDGNNSIDNWNGSQVKIESGKGEDTIVNRYGSQVTINTNEGNDVIENYQPTVVIDAGDGKDSISNGNRQVTINAGNGDDSIYNYDSQVSINAGDGNDSILNILDSQVTINSGDGNDFIQNGDIHNNASLVAIDAGIGNDIIFNYGSKTTINAGDGSDVIRSNNVLQVSIDAGDGNDDIGNYGSQVTINAGDGNDTIGNSGSQVTINSGDGDDSIFNGGNTVSIYAGSGNDSVYYNDGDNVTINAGNGDDIIYLNSYSYDNVIEYTNGDGKDTIYGFDTNDRLKISGGTYSTVVNGNDIIVKVSSGSITFKNVKDSKLNIIGTKSTDTTPPDTIDNSTSKTISNSSNNIVITGTSGADTIDNYGSYATINAGTGNDSIDNRNAANSVINAGGGNDFISSAGKYNTLNGGAGNDTINGWTSNMFINGGGGSDSLYTGNYETNVTVFGGDGDDNIISWNNKTLLNGGKGNDTINAYGSSATISYADGDGNDIVYGYDKTDTIKIASNTFSTQNSGDDVIVKVGTGSINLKNAKNIKLNIISDKIDTISSDLKYNIDKTSVTLPSSYSGTLKSTDYASTVKFIDASKVTKGIKIIGSDKANSIKGGKGADTLTGGKGNDIFIYSSGDGNDVITDYTAGQDKIKITGSKITKTSVNGSDVILAVGSGNIKIKNGKGKKLSLYNNSSSLTNTVIGGSKTITVNNSTKSPVTVSADVTTIDASKRSTAVKITGNTKANTIKGSSSKDTIYDGNGNDSILGNSGNDKLYGDAGNDTLNGGKGNDTLTGGAGKDVFFFASSEGNDVITDYTTTQGDLIRLGVSSMNTSTSGNNVILKVGTGKITINNAKSQQVSVIGSTGKSTVIGGTTTLNVTNSTKSPVTITSTIKVIDASKRTIAVKLTGNSLANTIKGGSGVDTIYGGAGNDSILGNNGNDKLFGDNGNDTLRGGAGNDSVSGGAGADKLYGDNGADTLNGGKGNDTLTGGSGNDVFVYDNDDDNDVITDYTANQDKIKLTSGAISGFSLKGSDVVLKIGSGSITVKNGKKTSITVIDSKGKSTSQVYGTSSKNYTEKLWFEVDDSCVSDDISAISQQNMSYANNTSGATEQITTFDANTILNSHSHFQASLLVDGSTKKK